MFVHQMQSVSKFAKKLCHNWLTWSEYIGVFIAIFAIPREPLKLRQHVRHISKVFWRHILCCLKSVFVKSSGEQNNLAAKQCFYSTTCGERQNTAENSFCIQNSTIFKTLKKCRQKNSICFWGSREKSFFGRFLSFFVFEGQYHQFHITKKSEARRTCWH